MKRFIALTVAILMTLNFVACAEKESDNENNSEIISKTTTTAETTTITTTTTVTTTVATTTTKPETQKPVLTTTEQKEPVLEEKPELLPDIVLTNNELNWLAHYPITPVSTAMPSYELEMFEEVYGGKVVENVVSWNKRYTELAKLIISGESPDIFPASDMDAFPKGVVLDLFQPVDDYIDYDDKLWADVSDVADNFSVKDECYVAVTDVLPASVCVYNRNLIMKNGYDDPANLFKNGEWTLEAFYEMCKLDEDKSICGWWYSDAIQQTCGVPLIGMNENGAISNNMEKAEVKAVEDYMLNLAHDCSEYRDTAEIDTIESFKDGDCLFFPVGLWAIEDMNNVDYSESNISFVPMPKNTLDGNKTYHIGSIIEGYLLCADAPNPDAFKAFVSCARACAIDEKIQLEKDAFRIESYGWTNEMNGMYHIIKDMALENPVFEMYRAISDDATSTFEQITGTTMWNFVIEKRTWNDVIKDYKPTVDKFVDDVNQTLE